MDWCGETSAEVTDTGEVSRGGKMALRETDPESYVTQYTFMYEEFRGDLRRGDGHQVVDRGARVHCRHPKLLRPGSGFRFQGSWFRVQGSGFRVQGSGFRVQGSGCRVQGSGFRIQG